MEDEPVMKITTGNGEIEARRENTSLFTHLGRLACYDHVFLQTGSEDEMIIGTYIFSHHPAYEEMAEYMFANDYPMILNKLTVADCDLTAWERMVHEDAEDELEYGIPDDWISNGQE